MPYRIKKTQEAGVRLDADWNSPDWNAVGVIEVNVFREDRGGDHRPTTQCKLQYNDEGIYGLFQVQDRYVRSRVTQFQGPVCKDSCVEFFVQPPSPHGYLNFEFNAGGSLLVYHVINPTRTEHGFKERHSLTEADIEGLRIFHSLPDVVEPEIQQETVWRLGFFIPFSTFERTTGLTGKRAGQVWRANFYKCGDETSHPHWASWQPLSATNFHLPACFGEIVFEAQR